MFENVVGHKKQLSEISNVLNWFDHNKDLLKKGINTPKGMILYGPPGNGKTLIIKDIIENTKANVIVINGDSDNVLNETQKAFEEAKRVGHSIIVIDELDLLLDDDTRLRRILQDNIDGVNANDDLLILAATNNIIDIPDAILRSGRLDKCIRIDYLDSNELLALLDELMEKYDLRFSDDYDEELLKDLIGGTTTSCTDILALVNDFALRYNEKIITMTMVENSLDIIKNDIKKVSDKQFYQVAIHEAGHAVMLNRFNEYFKICQMTIDGPSGRCNAVEVKEKNFYSFPKMIADIKISMSGALATRIILNTGSNGCEKDLQRARNYAYNMFNANGYKGCYLTLPDLGIGRRRETFIKRRKMEKRIESFLKKCENDAIKYIKRNKNKVISLANELMIKKKMNNKEIISILN